MSVPSVIITTLSLMNSSAISIEDVYKRSAVMELHINVGYVSFIV
jgi:hypothetical protein